MKAEGVESSGGSFQKSRPSVQSSSSMTAVESTSGKRSSSSVAVTPPLKLRVALMFSPAMKPMPEGDGSTSCGVIGRPAVVAVALTERQWPAKCRMLLTRCVPMFIRP